MILKNKAGFSVLTAVILTLSIGLSLGVFIVLLGSSELEALNLKQRQSEVERLAEDCIEEAIFKIKKNSSYLGETLNLSNGSCVILVSGSSTLTVSVVANIGNFTKRITIIGSMVTNSSGKAKKFLISDWQEL